MAVAICQIVSMEVTVEEISSMLAGKNSFIFFSSWFVVLIMFFVLAIANLFLFRRVISSEISREVEFRSVVKIDDLLNVLILMSSEKKGGWSLWELLVFLTDGVD